MLQNASPGSLSNIILWIEPNQDKVKKLLLHLQLIISAESDGSFLKLAWTKYFC